MTGAVRTQAPHEGIAEARRLEWWTLFWIGTIIALMYAVMGSSQAMKTAWIEDCLSLLPPIMFLTAGWFEKRPPTPGFPFGFQRVGSLAFFAAACALLALGFILLFNAAMTLYRQEHATVGTFALAGHEIWLGWPMMAVLLYSAIPPIILGRMKMRPARSIADKILHTDAAMNSADWQTGLAGIVGVAGIGFGYWWADAVAAGFISFSVLQDGWTNVKIAFAELIDGAPRALETDELHPDVERIRAAILARHPGAEVRLRETGRHIRGVIEGATVDPGLVEEARRAMKDEWRLLEIASIPNPAAAAPSPARQAKSPTRDAPDAAASKVRHKSESDPSHS